MEARFYMGTDMDNKPQPDKDRAAFPGFRQIGESGAWAALTDRGAAILKIMEDIKK